MAAINELTKHYNCTAVLCTATQPALEKLFAGQPVKEICSNIEENYNFFKRNTIKVLEGKISDDELAEQLKTKRKVLCIVNTKKTAEKIFEKLTDEENIFYLSTNLCPIHRTQIMQKIKSCLEENQVCRVVSTSLVETGVDWDFPCVYRELVGLDSIIQAAGHCNREGKFSADSPVYVFQLADEKSIKNQSLRINATNLICEKYISAIDSPQAINNYFNYLHKLEGNNLDKKLILENLCKEWKFKDIAEKFKLIEENTKSVFIPYNEEAQKIAKQLLTGEVSRTLLRKAGKYIVNVYYGAFREMLATKKITPIDEYLAILADWDLYDKNIGLKSKIEEGAAVIF